MSIKPITLLENNYLDAFPNLYDVKITAPSTLTNELLPAVALVTAADGTVTTPAVAAVTLAIDTRGRFLNVRASSVTLPELTVNTYKVDYKGIDLTRPGSEITGERKLSIKFRMDANYNLLKALKAWKEIYGTDTGEGELKSAAYSISTTTPAPTNTGTIVIQSQKKFSADDENDVVNEDFFDDVAQSGTFNDTYPQWEFTGVRCLKVGYPTYARDGSSIIEVEAQFNFEGYNIKMEEEEEEEEEGEGEGEGEE